MRNGCITGFNFGQKTGFRTVLGKGDHIAIPQVYVGDSLPVDVGAVGTGVDDTKPVSLSINPGMSPGNGCQVFVKTNLARRVSADVDGKLRKILDLPFQWALDVNQLDSDLRRLGHVVPPGCINSRVAVLQ